MLLLRLVRGNGFGGVPALVFAAAAAEAGVADSGGDAVSSSKDDCSLFCPSPKRSPPSSVASKLLALSGTAASCTGGCGFSSSRYLLSNFLMMSILLSCRDNSLLSSTILSSSAPISHSSLGGALTVAERLMGVDLTATVGVVMFGGVDLTGGRLALFFTISVRLPR